MFFNHTNVARCHLIIGCLIGTLSNTVFAIKPNATTETASTTPTSEFSTKPIIYTIRRKQTAPKAPVSKQEQATSSESSSTIAPNSKPTVVTALLDKTTTSLNTLSVESSSASTPPTTTIVPFIVITCPLVENTVLTNNETLSEKTSQQKDESTFMLNKLSAVFAQLQEEPMSVNDRRESFLMLKYTVHEELKKSLKENPNNTVHFANLETKAFLFVEKINQELQCECLNLQTKCFKRDPYLDDVD